jgi:hypothetical protein
MRIAAWRCSDLQRASPLIRRNLKPIGFDHTRFLPSARPMPLPGAPANPSGVKIALLRYARGEDSHLVLPQNAHLWRRSRGRTTLCMTSWTRSGTGHAACTRQFDECSGLRTIGLGEPFYRTCSSRGMSMRLNSRHVVREPVARVSDP